MMRVLKRSAGLWGSLAVALTVGTAGAAPLDAEQADRLRIQRHLAQVEQQLRARPVDTLPSAARQARARLLDELHHYWQAGVFPRNSQHVGERRPYFIDDAGRACAVGALVIESGHVALAQRIDRTFHTEYVPNMSDPELLAWADAHGFSGAELALIQPTYCNCDGLNGAFPGEEAAGGAGGTPNGADYFQPVCGDNGLTYWNECIATLCGDVTIVSTGQCEQEAPPCELCGTGDKPIVVSECAQDTPEGICNGIDSQPDVVPVNDVVAAHWLELQGQGCQDPTYELEKEEQAWQPSWPVQAEWQCEAASSGAGAGGAAGAGGDDSANAGAETTNAGAAADAHGGAAGASPSNPDGQDPTGDEPAGGCDCRSGRAPGQPWFGAALLVGWVALLGLRRRRSRRRQKLRQVS